MRLLILILLLAIQHPGDHKPPRAAAPRGTIAHQATLNYSNGSCTNTNLCNLQVYRALCASPPQCPVYSPGSASFVNIITLGTTTATASPTATGTTWQVLDKDPNLADGAMYTFVATNSYQSSATNYSPASTAWTGTTSSAPTVPPAPLVGSGNTIQ